MVEIQDAVAHGPARRVTIADIARDLGISKAAVSYALNGQPGVAADTRQRVLDRGRRAGLARQQQCAGAVRRPDRRGRAGAGAAAGPADHRDLLHALPRRASRRSSPRRLSLLLRVVGDHPDEEIHVYERWWGERRIDGVILLDERYPRPAHQGRSSASGCLQCCAEVRSKTGAALLWTDQVGDAAVAVQHLVRPRPPPHRPRQRAQRLRPRARPAARSAPCRRRAGDGAWRPSRRRTPGPRRAR